MPDIMTPGRRRRRRRPDPRPAGQDDRPLRERRRPHGDPRLRRRTCSRRTILEWRMNTAGYDSKFAALYYPWIEVMDPLTNQPMMVPPSGHVAGVWCRTDATRGVHKAPGQRGRHGRQRPRLPGHARGAGRPQQGRHQLHPRVPRAAASACGARARCRATPSGATSTSAGSSTTSPSRSWRARSGACSSPTTSSCGSSCGSRRRTSSRACGATARCSAPRRTQAFFVKCDAETNPPEVIEAGQVICEIGIAPVKPAEFVIFRLSQFSGGEGAVRQLSQSAPLSERNDRHAGQ